MDHKILKIAFNIKKKTKKHQYFKKIIPSTVNYRSTYTPSSLMCRRASYDEISLP